MVVDWHFERKRRSQKSRDPMQASFFTNASIDDDTHALVREAIQNSLDAKADRDSPEPVRVRFYIGCHKAEGGVMDRYLSEEAWLHFNAPDNGLREPPTSLDDCRFLVYEDFNTHGLIGDERASEVEGSNSFYYFMRAEGQSGKDEGERGRHGIGKYVFPYTSRIRMFIAATVRSEDERCLIAGQSVLKSHHVSGQPFTPDGWWGAFEKDAEDDYFQLPVEDKNLFEQLREDFGLERELGQIGLSLVMPYVQEEVTTDKLSEHIIREYFWPILQQQLVVDVIEGGVRKSINSESIHSNLDELLLPEKAEEISEYINLAVKSLRGKDYSVVKLNLPSSPSMPVWDKDYLGIEAASAIQQELSKESAVVCINCPIYVQLDEKASTASKSYFEIFLSKDISETSKKPLFIREGITIPEDRVPQIRGYTSIVVIEPGGLATLLGDSENPAHTEWEKNAVKFKGKYRWGAKTIDFVRLSVRNLLKSLSQADDEVDVTLLSDIFYVDMPENEEEVPSTRKRKKRPMPGSEPEPRPMPPPSPKPRTYRLSKIDGGFIVQGPVESLGHPRSYHVKVAYDLAGASKARAFKCYHKNDFDLNKGRSVDRPKVENLKDLEIRGNTISFTADGNDFKVVATGFDRNRDIIVDIQSEAMTDETV